LTIIRSNDHCTELLLHHSIEENKQIFANFSNQCIESTIKKPLAIFYNIVVVVVDDADDVVVVIVIVVALVVAVDALGNVPRNLRQKFSSKVEFVFYVRVFKFKCQQSIAVLMSTPIN